MIDKGKLCMSKQYYTNGEILYLPNSNYILLRVSGKMPFPIMLDGFDHICIGTYAIINVRTGNVVCTREIFDYDLKVLGYIAENNLSGDFANVLHYDGGARLTEYMDRIRRRSFVSREKYNYYNEGE